MVMSSGSAANVNTRVDQQGNIQSAFNPSLVLTQPAGGWRRTLGGVFTRRRVHYVQGYSVAAASIPTSNTYGTGFSVADANELLLYACIISGTGAAVATGLKVFLQLYDPQTTSWFDHPTTTSAGIALTLSGTGSQIATPATGITNFGDLIRVGVICTSTTYTGGTFFVMVKEKA